LRHLALTVDLEDLYKAYPRLTEEDVKACLAFAGAALEGEAPVFKRRRTAASAG